MRVAAKPQSRSQSLTSYEQAFQPHQDKYRTLALVQLNGIWLCGHRNDEEFVPASACRHGLSLYSMHNASVHRKPAVLVAQHLFGIDAPEIIIARVTAEQKMLIVQALQRKGETVAVTGDR